MSVHQYLDFCGHMGVRGCEARAMARLKGEFTEETTTAMLVGSYVDSYFEGTLKEFIAEHPECFTAKGELKAPFKQAETMIKRCENSKEFMKHMNGQKQVIITFYLFGCMWKAKLDVLHPGIAIDDLKTSADIHKMWKVKDYGYVPFTEYWGYTLQGAIYQKGIEIVYGTKLPFYIDVVTKSDHPELKILYIPQTDLNHALNEIEMNMESVIAVKNGEAEPIRCENCDYCHETEEITGPINHNDLTLGE